MRVASDPLHVLKYVRDAELLLNIPPTSESATIEQRLADFDAVAFDESIIKVAAQPWTTVVGDGIVSSLVSSFFMWDSGSCYSLVDRGLFLRNMQGGMEQSEYCSPLLVNAICAIRSVSCPSPLTNPRENT